LLACCSIFEGLSLSSDLEAEFTNEAGPNLAINWEGDLFIGTFNMASRFS
jgi:hypothetical protein